MDYSEKNFYEVGTAFIEKFLGKMKRNCKILTKEQHDVLGRMCDVWMDNLILAKALRGDGATVINMFRCMMFNSMKEEIDAELSRVGLPGIKWRNDLNGYDTSTDYEEEEKYNEDIERYLVTIDKYC